MGNEYGYIYFLVDPLLYYTTELLGGLGASIGINIDMYKDFNTNITATQRIYDTGDSQLLIKVSEGIRIDKNFQIVLKYDYKDKIVNKREWGEDTFTLLLKYYF
jgi:hypothetical protein